MNECINDFGSRIWDLGMKAKYNRGLRGFLFPIRDIRAIRGPNQAL
jgi:hypothetical protein